MPPLFPGIQAICMEYAVELNAVQFDTGSGKSETWNGRKIVFYEMQILFLNFFVVFSRKKVFSALLIYK